MNMCNEKLLYVSPAVEVISILEPFHLLAAFSGDVGIGEFNPADPGDEEL